MNAPSRVAPCWAPPRPPARCRCRPVAEAGIRASDHDAALFVLLARWRETRAAWDAAGQRVRGAMGFTAASEAEDAAGRAWNDADDAVKLHQPRTLAGLVRKAEWVAERLASGGCDDDLGEVFARRVAAFGRAAA